METNQIIYTENQSSGFYMTENDWNIDLKWNNGGFYHNKNKPLDANVPFLYPLRMSESQRFSDISGGIEMKYLTSNGLISSEA